MNPLITALRHQREFPVEVQPGVTITMRRPAEADMHMLRELTKAEVACRFAVGWAGVTESILLGAGVGAEDAVPFEADLWVEVVMERLDWLLPCADAVIDAVSNHLTAKADAAKN